MAARQRGIAPGPSDDFVGRHRELDRLATLLLGKRRLITVVGPGGIGKTRLVAEAVHRFGRARQEPVPWVRLARLPKSADATAVADEIVRSVVGHDFSGRPSWEALIETLTDSSAPRPLVVIDNCEHVLAAAGAAVTELLDAVPTVTVLATSRGRVGWVDEQVLRVPPLSDQQAIELFCRRAELTSTTVTDTETVRSICRHLNNQPLHIRLAAARLFRQPLRAIARDLTGEQTDRRLAWPADPHFGAEERHQAIGDVIAWSFDLCGDSERLLLERMSVFAPGGEHGGSDIDVVDVGADLDAVRTICSGPDGTGLELAPDQIEGLLERLADQSLVSVHLSGDRAHYSLLESIRVFARQRVAARGDAEPRRLAARHRRYYRDRIRSARSEWFSHRERELLNWASASWDNLLLAVEGSMRTPGEAVIGLEIVSGMIALRVPFFRGSLRDARCWAEQTLAATADDDPDASRLRLATRAAVAWICLCQGLPDDAARMLHECATLCLTDDDARSAWLDDPVPDRAVPGTVEFAAGCTLMLVHGDVRALVVLARAREKFTAAGDYGNAAMSELFEALTAAFLGNRDQALALTRRHLDNTTRAQGEWATSWAEIAWIIAETRYGDAHQAIATARATLARQIAMRDAWGAVWTVHALVWALSRVLTSGSGRSASAADTARLVGAADALRRRLGVEIAHLRPFSAETARAVERLRKNLGTNRFESLRQEGAGLRPPMAHVARLAQGEGPSTDQRAPTGDAERSWDHLTHAEREVAVLAAAGWTNAAIATRRGSSRRTVDAQIAAVLRKLTIDSREDISALIPPGNRDGARAAR
ncbi:ATP-binding protein [Nocardia veterana]|uniref:LuxR family transcriptional regulator n=1 Tax=Nocardia veterana TaxID=132249 RepID=A0A7X6M0M6_9NOCA|nr:AAA family ATPase [Nocardia veterana]NKY88110.1 LuxR family transcriptional regulator [Nocardia veterana]